MLSALRTALFRPAAIRSTNALSSFSIRSFNDEAKAAAPAGSGGQREVGTVKWFDAAKGFGFLVRENGTDVFIHFTGIRGTGYRTLEEGQKIEFTMGSGSKGPVASDAIVKH